MSQCDLMISLEEETYKGFGFPTFKLILSGLYTNI